MRMGTARSLITGVALALYVHGAHADVASSAGSILHQVPAPPVSRAQPLTDTVEVWVDLTLPPTASVPRTDRAERAALLRRIVEQQNEVMAKLAKLGAVEVARVQHSRNALAVRIPAGSLDRAREIPGVRAVSLVRHPHRNMR